MRDYIIQDVKIAIEAMTEAELLSFSKELAECAGLALAKIHKLKSIKKAKSIRTKRRSVGYEKTNTAHISFNDHGSRSIQTRK